MTLKKEVEVITCKVRNGIIRSQISKSIKVVLNIFALALTVSEILTCKNNLDLLKVKVTNYNFSNDTNRWPISKSTKDSSTFSC